MDAVEVLVLSERERLGPVETTLIIGVLSDEARSQLAGRLSSTGVAEFLSQEPSLVSKHDLVVHVGEGPGSELERRTLGQAIAQVANRAVITVHAFGAELPIPLVEVKRGVVLDHASLAYRVYVNREVQL